MQIPAFIDMIICLNKTERLDLGMAVIILTVLMTLYALQLNVRSAINEIQYLNKYFEISSTYHKSAPVKQG